MRSSGSMLGRRALLAGSAALIAGGSVPARALASAQCPDGNTAWIPSEDLLRDLPRVMRIAGYPAPPSRS